MAFDVMNSQACRERGWTSVPAFNELLAAQRQGRVEADFPLWWAVNAELWAREYL